jgi:hypothetical protein
MSSCAAAATRSARERGSRRRRRKNRDGGGARSAADEQLDFSASQRITSKLRIFVELINLTDEPYRVYEGSSDRPVQEEYYSWWGTIGVKVNF